MQIARKWSSYFHYSMDTLQEEVKYIISNNVFLDLGLKRSTLLGRVLETENLNLSLIMKYGSRLHIVMRF